LARRGVLAGLAWGQVRRQRVTGRQVPARSGHPRHFGIGQDRITKRPLTMSRKDQVSPYWPVPTAAATFGSSPSPPRPPRWRAFSPASASPRPHRGSPWREDLRPGRKTTPEPSFSMKRDFRAIPSSSRSRRTLSITACPGQAALRPLRASLSPDSRYLPFLRPENCPPNASLGLTCTKERSIPSWTTSNRLLTGGSRPRILGRGGWISHPLSFFHYPCRITKQAADRFAERGSNRLQ